MDLAIHTFETVKRIFAGVGCLARVAEAAAFGPRCVLVTGRSSMRTLGVTDRVIAYLAAAGVEAAVFEGVEGDPSVATVDAIRRTIAVIGADFVVGLGGGSAMDAAKAAGGLAAEDAPTSVFLNEQREARRGIPVVAIATTSGTGAEATPNAVISDPASKVKASIRNGSFMPAMAIVDPELALPCPPRVTSHSGMDAIAQAVESFVSIHATPLTDALAFEAFRLLWANLITAYRNGGDLSARTACAYGSLMAGIALANARLGAVHGMAHPLGVRYGIPHGLICAILLPEVIRINLPCSAAKYARLSHETGGSLVDAVINLNRVLHVYEDFQAYRVPQEDFGLIADESMPSGSLKANPKRFTREDVLAVLRAVTGAKEGGG